MIVTNNPILRSNILNNKLEVRIDGSDEASVGRLTSALWMKYCRLQYQCTPTIIALQVKPEKKKSIC